MWTDCLWYTASFYSLCLSVCLSLSWQWKQIHAFFNGWSFALPLTLAGISLSSYGWVDIRIFLPTCRCLWWKYCILRSLLIHILSGSKLVCRNQRSWFLVGRNRPATSFRISHSVPFFHRRPGYYSAKPARVRFSSGRLPGFGQMDPVRKQAGVQE